MQIKRMKLTNLKNPSIARVSCVSVAFLATLIAGQTVFAAQGDIYKSVNDAGSTVFTDQPTGNATTIAPPKLNVVKSPKRVSDVRASSNEHPESSSVPSPLTVSSVEITNPTHEKIIINPRESILVGVKTGPENGMPTGYTTEILMDGNVVSSSAGTLLAIPVPDRGLHTLKAVILNAAGAVQASSQTITIHVMKSTVNN